MSTPLVSIVVTNHNYEPFLRGAIDSALDQTHPATEVVVVDDGSTDHSLEVIASYGDAVVPVSKENGGQGSAVNAGWRAARGDAVIFLDADDALLPTAAATAARLVCQPGVAKAHWPLRVVDGAGRAAGVWPEGPLPAGDLRCLLTHSPDYVTPPQSGNAFSRSFLDAVLPMPEAEFVTGADTYLFLLSIAFGEVRATNEPQGLYRRHGSNNYSGHPFDDRLARVLTWSETSYDALAEHCARLGVEADPDAWRRNSWAHRLAASRDELDDLIPERTPFVLIDDGDWGMQVDERRRPIPFLERNGQYWGPPPDDATAVSELERLSREGAAYAVVAWASFWWLDHYPALARRLRSLPVIADNDRMVVFRLGATCA